MKDGREITSDPKLYDISIDESEGRNSVFTVQSTLRFLGHDRPNDNQLLPEDRGLYACTYENPVKKAESSMHLRIERKYDREVENININFINRTSHFYVRGTLKCADLETCKEEMNSCKDYAFSETWSLFQ